LDRLKEIVEIIFALIYAVFLLIQKKPSRIVIYYHSLKKKDVRQFEKQMAYVADKFRVVKPSEVRTARVKGRSALVAITFDDAFVSILENAIPVLKKHGFNAGIFVPAGSLGLSPDWAMSYDCSDKNETVMSLEQIAELGKDGFEIFSHTISHPRLTQIDENRLRHELLESKKKLEEVIGREVLGISYPYGAHDARVCGAAKDAGYKLGFTIEPNTVNCSLDDMKIGRFAVCAADSMLKFRLKVIGAYQAVKYLQRLKSCLCRS
jgi:peptidoglycan/xylan/chitin deacetylase (PgdA/CDA1 family)